MPKVPKKPSGKTIDMEGTVKEFSDMASLFFCASAYSNLITVSNLVWFSKAFKAGFSGANPLLMIAAFLGACSMPRTSVPMSEAAELMPIARKTAKMGLKRTEAI
jgi:hypothetical protein